MKTIIDTLKDLLVQHAQTDEALVRFAHSFGIGQEATAPATAVALGRQLATAAQTVTAPQASAKATVRKQTPAQRRATSARMKQYWETKRKTGAAAAAPAPAAAPKPATAPKADRARTDPPAPAPAPAPQAEQLASV